MKTIITINFNNYSENNTVLSLDCLVSLVERMKEDSNFLSFEISQAGGDVEAVNEILFSKETEKTLLLKFSIMTLKIKLFQLTLLLEKMEK